MQDRTTPNRHRRASLTDDRASLSRGRIRIAHGRGIAFRAAAALCLAVAGCDSSNPASAPTTADPLVVARSNAVAAYTGMWTAWAQAGETSDFRTPALARYATGEALKTLIDRLRTNSKRQRFYRGRPVLAPQVTKVSLDSSPATAQIVDCADGTTWRTVNANGDEIGTDEGHRKVTASVSRVDGDWKVTTFVVQGDGTC